MLAALNVADATGGEDTAIALNLSAAIADTDSSETLSIITDSRAATVNEWVD